MGSTGDNKITNRNGLSVTDSFLARFWEKVDKNGPYIKRLDSCCWSWIGALAGPNGNQYGTIWINGRLEKAHRMSYVVHYGAIPAGYHVCHHCDNPACVNPGHLYAGSQRRNLKDAVRRGRRSDQRGEGNHNSKLTEHDVVMIRQLVNQGHSQADIARRFSISQQHVYNIIHFNNWSHVGGYDGL